VAEILELAELPKYDGVAEVKIGAARIAAQLDDEGFAGLLGLLQLLDKRGFGRISSTPRRICSSWTSIGGKVGMEF
jgi:hypothetical protein